LEESVQTSLVKKKKEFSLGAKETCDGYVSRDLKSIRLACANRARLQQATLHSPTGLTATPLPFNQWKYRARRRQKHHRRIYGPPFSTPFPRRVQYPQNKLFSLANHLLGNRLCRQPFSKSLSQMNKRTTNGQTLLLVMTLQMSGMRLMKVTVVILQIRLRFR